jgi:hypothetical protein
MGATNQARLKLARHVRRVRPGVPLRPSGHDDWEISPSGADARWLAATNATGGEMVDAWKSGTFRPYLKDMFKAGDQLAIEYIDDHGHIHLRLDPNGPIEAIDSECIFMSAPLK